MEDLSSLSPIVSLRKNGQEESRLLSLRRLLRVFKTNCLAAIFASRHQDVSSGPLGSPCEVEALSTQSAPEGEALANSKRELQSQFDSGPAGNFV